MSAIIELSEDLLTGVPEMDEQHRVLVALLNETYALLREGQREAAREKLLSGVVAYADFHFQAEEAFQRRVGFPDYEAHCKVHEAFKKNMLQWVEEARGGDEQALREILSMIWAWLFQHIGVKDKAYGAFWRARGGAEG